MNPSAERHSTQLLKGVLDLCLLALLAHEPCYGYEMVQKLTASGLDLVSQGSIYPVLGRLQQRGLIEGYLVASIEGPSRKYYRLLPEGEAQLKQWAAEWEAFSAAVDQVVKGSSNDASANAS